MAIIYVSVMNIFCHTVYNKTRKGVFILWQKTKTRTEKTLTNSRISRTNRKTSRISRKTRSNFAYIFLQRYKLYLIHCDKQIKSRLE